MFSSSSPLARRLKSSSSLNSTPLSRVFDDLSLQGAPNVIMADLIGGFDGNLLYDLACECEELFDSTIPGPPEDSSVWSECQQRFAIWASHIGVFARESQSLDTRLRKAPDVQDLVARILDILRRSLTQCEKQLLLSIAHVRHPAAQNVCTNNP